MVCKLDLNLQRRGGLKPLWEKQQTFQSPGPKQSPCLFQEERRKQNQSACGGEETSCLQEKGRKPTADSRQRLATEQECWEDHISMAQAHKPTCD